MLQSKPSSVQKQQNHFLSGSTLAMGGVKQYRCRAPTHLRTAWQRRRSCAKWHEQFQRRPQMQGKSSPRTWSDDIACRHKYVWAERRARAA